jgi:uncharacterized protein (TIGR03083 family)
MDRQEVAAVVRAERLSLAETLESLTPDEWEHPSLCTGWRVRDVAAHLTLGTRFRPVEGLVQFVRARGNVNRLIHDSAVRRAREIEPPQIVADLRAAAESRRRVPGTSYLDPMADVLVHGQDIAVPLGRPRPMPLDAAAVAATRDWTMRFFGARRRLAGLHLSATDVSWSAGEGALVEGPIASLLLVITARPAGLAQLGGEGLPLLTARLTPAPARTS